VREPDDLLTEASVTRRLVSLARGRAGRTALLADDWPAGLPGGADGCGYDTFAAVVQAAAAGLSWRGLRPRDAVGVLVPDAVSFAVASHAVRAAGGVPSPVDPGLCPAEMAGQLAESGARMIITSAGLADLAVAAADRSWVRQVLSFGEAPGATPFADLLGPDAIAPARGRPDDVALLPFARAADGRVRPAPVTHRGLLSRIDELDRQARIGGGDVVVAGPPAGDGLAYALLVDGALLRGATVIAVRLADLAVAAAAARATVALVPRGARADLPAGVRAIPVG